MRNAQSIVSSKIKAGAAAVGFGLLALAGPLTATAQTTHHRSWMHRHPTATTAGAGVGAYALAKHSKHGVFHRHPVLTGIGAAAVAHHYAKKHRN